MTAEWSSAGWRAAAVAWLDEGLAAAGLVRTGPVTQPRIRSWGTVLTAATSGGTVWMKATGAATAYEVAIYELLTRVVPGRVLAPIALDAERGWLLLPDGGPTGVGTALPAVLAQYAQLQREVMPYVEHLVAAGVPDMRPAVMPARFDEAVAAVEELVARRGDEADRETMRAIRGRRDQFVDWCAQLVDARVPPSIDHNDLHPGNVFVAGEPLTARFYDWGDSVVAHPFTSMLMATGGLAVDAYLEPFADLAPRAQLVAELELACRVATVARTLTWVRAVGVDGSDERFAMAPLESLAAVASPSWIDVSG